MYKLLCPVTRCNELKNVELIFKTRVVRCRAMVPHGGIFAVYKKQLKIFQGFLNFEGILRFFTYTYSRSVD